MRTWESVACVHTVISSGHTKFLAQGLLTHFTNKQITIQLGIQTTQTSRRAVVSHDQGKKN